MEHKSIWFESEDIKNLLIEQSKMATFNEAVKKEDAHSIQEMISKSTAHKVLLEYSPTLSKNGLRPTRSYIEELVKIYSEALGYISAYENYCKDYYDSVNDFTRRILFDPISSECSKKIEKVAQFLENMGIIEEDDIKMALRSLVDAIDCYDYVTAKNECVVIWLTRTVHNIKDVLNDEPNELKDQSNKLQKEINGASTTQKIKHSGDDTHNHHQKFQQEQFLQGERVQHHFPQNREL